MDLDILDDKENKVMHRKEIRLKVSGFGATPNKEEIKKSLTAKVNANESNVVVDRVDQKYGKSEAVCYVKVYESVEFKDKFEPKVKPKKGEEKPKQEKPEQEKKAEEKKPEPKEAEKEEPKKEELKEEEGIKK